MKFANRVAAGQLLAKTLLHFTGPKTLVLALPRGGVPVGLEVAKILNSKFDILVVRKIGAPGNPELAIGAVGAQGKPFLDRRLISDLGVAKNFLDAEVKRKRGEAKDRDRLLRKKRKPISQKGKQVILVDDGLATGATAMAAASLIAKKQVTKKILAVPVAPPSTIENVRKYFDEVVVLSTPFDFAAVGQFYDDFSEVSDEEIVKMLEEYPKE